jgi:hypothetical protein
MRTRFQLGWAVVLLLLGTAWALGQLFDVSTRGGEAYPRYSSLRADPMGAKAMHDSLAALPGYRVERSFKERFRPVAGSVVFVLDARPDASILNDCRRWAEGGARVVVAFQARPAKKDKAVEQQWKIEFQTARADKRWTVFVPRDESWSSLKQLGDEVTIAEKQIGKGSVVFVGQGVVLSNEGLHKGRDSALLLAILGGRRHVVFEESHLGVVQTGSVGQLLRRYRLGGAAAVLLVLAALFFWRSSSSSLPEAAVESTPVVTSQDDALVSLVRGAIPADTLAASALALWSRGGGMLKSWSAARRNRVEQALRDGGPVLAAWNRAHEILKRNST